MTSSLSGMLALLAIGIWALISVMTAFSISRIRAEAWHRKLIYAVDDSGIFGNDCGRCRYAALLFFAPLALIIVRSIMATVTALTANDAFVHFCETLSEKWSKFCPPLSVERLERARTETTLPRQ